VNAEENLLWKCFNGLGFRKFGEEGSSIEKRNLMRLPKVMLLVDRLINKETIFESGDL